jgi:hypothetical protein
MFDMELFLEEEISKAKRFVERIAVDLEMSRRRFESAKIECSSNLNSLNYHNQRLSEFEKLLTLHQRRKKRSRRK